MGRKRLYDSVAERQRVYRQRLADRTAETASAPKTKPKRPVSRPARVALVMAEVQQLHDDYENWLTALPDSIQNGDQAERLRETIEQLETVSDILSELNPPRGFGRD